MKPLSLALIDQLFSFMVPLGFTTYQLELDVSAWSCLQTLMLDFHYRDAHLVGNIFDKKELRFQKDGMTLTFVQKCTTPQLHPSESL